MRKQLITFSLISTVVISSLFPMTSIEVKAAESDKVVVSAKQAVLEGVTLKDTPKEKAIEFDESHDAILGIGEFSTAQYTLPDSTAEGEYDIYLEVSKASSAFVFGSTPVKVSINGGEYTVPSLKVETCAMSQMGMGKEPTYMDDMGIFNIKKSVTLKAGDTITIGGVAGNEFAYNGEYSSSMPALGDLSIYPAGTEVKQGYSNNQFIYSTEKKDKTDLLSGLNIAWLGSSVTYGQGANGYSMADVIANTHKATTCDKFAISGTTLASCKYASSVPTDGKGSHGSYVERLKQIDKDAEYDLFIVQLSTNDATNGIPMGKLAKGTKYSDLNTATVIGAMEYIVKYVKQTWGCPVMFYSGSKYDSDQYQEMVDAMLLVQQKWDIGVINLWNNDQINSISDEDREKYIKADGIHPLKDGYEKWWTPAFESEITTYLLKTGAIDKIKQSISVTPTSKKIKASALKKNSVQFNVKTTNNVGKVTYKSSSKYVTVDNKSGKVTVKKKTPVGTYKITVKAAEAKTSNTAYYGAAEKVISIKVVK